MSSRDGYPAGPAAGDHSLIQAVIAGEPGARETFAQRYRSWITGLAITRFRFSADEAMDFFQDVMVRLWQDDLRALRAWRGEGKFSTYLMVIAGRLGLERVRNPEHRVESLAADAEQASSDEAGPEAAGPDADRRLLADERARAVRCALAELSDRDRLVLTLHYRDDQGFEDIGDVLGLKTGTARKAAFDARRRLRVLLLDRHADLFESDDREAEP